MQDVEPDVIRAAQAHDTAAFEKIYRHYAGMVYRVALRMTARVEDAEEVTQEVFVAVHRHLKTFAGQASLKTWIYRITMNCSLNALRKTKSTPEVAWDEGFDAEDPRHNLREQWDAQDVQARVEGMLAGLNPDQRACLLLRAQEGLSYDQIAQTLRININTVRSRLKRARETLLAERRPL